MARTYGEICFAWLFYDRYRSVACAKKNLQKNSEKSEGVQFSRNRLSWFLDRKLARVFDLGTSDFSDSASYVQHGYIEQQENYSCLRINRVVFFPQCRWEETPPQLGISPKEWVDLSSSYCIIKTMFWLNVSGLFSVFNIVTFQVQQYIFWKEPNDFSYTYAWFALYVPAFTMYYAEWQRLERFVYVHHRLLFERGHRRRKVRFGYVHNFFPLLWKFNVSAIGFGVCCTFVLRGCGGNVNQVQNNYALQ